MTGITTITVTPSAAANAYSRTEKGASGTAAPSAGFGATLEHMLTDAVQAGKTADAKSADAIAGHGSLTDVVTAVAHAELALQTTTAIRDRVVQAYQDIMRMPI